jgi:hypothetical protein
VGAKLFHADGRTAGQTDRQTDMTKLIVIFTNFANAPKYCGINERISVQSGKVT